MLWCRGQSHYLAIGDWLVRGSHVCVYFTLSIITKPNEELRVPTVAHLRTALRSLS